MADPAKLKLFNMLSVKKQLTKKEIEEQRKKEEEAAAAQAYEEFVAVFEEPVKHGKAFVRGTTFNAGTREEKMSSETGKLYKPTSKLLEVTPSFAVTAKKSVPPPPIDDAKEKAEKLRRREKEKKKSNLELFKEELKIIQEEREERHRMKSHLKDSPKATRFESFEAPAEESAKPPGYGSFDTGDPTTTNIYLGNINPKVTERQLCEVFGKFGPLASVKVMWPRSEEEKARGRNCGFVAFMNRKDAERALKSLNGKEVMSFEMKLGWGKPVPIPPHPVYIPPALVELTLPPPPSGLPFNAQPSSRDKDLIKIPPSGTPFTADELEKKEFEQVLMNAVVKVVIPTEKNLLCLIHRMVEFVVREGPLFEAMIMNREIVNPMFRFLFENQSPAHVYYRWKLFSILQGDSPNKWRTAEFRMFSGGSLWRPPPMNPYAQGMPEELVDAPDDLHNSSVATNSNNNSMSHAGSSSSRKGQLSNSQRDRLEEMIRQMTPERSKIADAMVYCIEHADAAEEIVDCISESLTILQTALVKKIARLYLVSDILHNCSVKIANVSYYRKGFQAKLPEIFKSLRETHLAIEGRLKAEQFKDVVSATDDDSSMHAVKPNSPAATDDLDGVPLGDAADLDGIPMGDDGEDIDGIPMGSGGRSSPKKSRSLSSPTLKYAPSKWETIDPSIIASQAMTTSKWDLLDQQDEDADQNDTNEEDLDGRPMDEDEYSSSVDDSRLGDTRDQEMLDVRDRADTLVSEERRAKLREIELKVTKFQDELESGRRTRKPDMSLAKQVEHYRQKLLRKEREKEEGSERRKDHRSPGSTDESSHDRRSKHSSSTSPHRGRSRSKSPKFRKSRSRSPRRRQRSYSPKKASHKSRSRSPRRQSVKSGSPSSRHKRSSSRSPGRRLHKSRSKSKR